MLLRRYVRNSKYEPLVEPVRLIEANPHFAHVKFEDGREDTVSILDLARFPEAPMPPGPGTEAPLSSPSSEDCILPAEDPSNESEETDSDIPRRSTRIPKPVVRLDL